MTGPIQRGIIRGGLTEFFILILLILAIPARAIVSIGPANTNAVAAEQQRFFQFNQAEQSYQAKIRVGQERYQQKQINRAKIIAGMSSELRARQQTVVIQPIPAPNGKSDEPAGRGQTVAALSMLAIGIAGFRYFVSRQNAPVVNEKEIVWEPETPVVPRKMADETFFCKAPGVDGRGVYAKDGFVVLKGSIGCSQTPESQEGASVAASRTELLNSGVMREEGDAIIFQEDHLFSTPSVAAAALMGMRVNGWLEWRTEDGIPLDSVERLERRE